MLANCFSPLFITCPTYKAERCPSFRIYLYKCHCQKFNQLAKAFQRYASQSAICSKRPCLVHVFKRFLCNISLTFVSIDVMFSVVRGQVYLNVCFIFKFSIDKKWPECEGSYTTIGEPENSHFFLVFELIISTKPEVIVKSQTKTVLVSFVLFMTSLNKSAGAFRQSPRVAG